MPITFNFTTLADCEAVAQLTGITPASTPAAALADNTDFSQRYGTQCVDFDFNAAVTNGGVKLATNLTGGNIFDLTDREVGIWLLNPKFDGDGVELLPSADTSLRLRVYSSQSGAERYADYYQVQHRNKVDGTWNGGWLYLRASGDAGTEDANGGTWTTTDAQNINNVGVVVTTSAANNSGTGGDAPFGVDWIKHYDSIDVTGYQTGTTPWDLPDIVAAANTTPGTGPVGIWGIVEQQVDFFKFFCGINFGDITPTAGGFTAENQYIFLAPSSSDVDYDIVIRDDFLVNLGEKNATGTFTYAQDGCQLVCAENGFFAEASPVKCAPLLTIESGGLFDAYATLIQGFGTVNLGSGSTTAGDIELIGADFYDNDEVEFRSTGLQADNVRVHQDSADKGTLGTIYSIPNQFDRVNTFNGTDGLTFRVTMTADQFSAGDLTFDVVVLDGQEVTLLDSNFDIGAVKRIV